MFGMYLGPDCSQCISTKMPIGVVLHICFIGSPVSSSTNLWDSPESRVKSLDRSPKTQAGLWREQVLQNPAFSCTGGHYTYICQFWYIATLFRPVVVSLQKSTPPPVVTVETNISYGHLPNSFLNIVNQPGLPHHINRAVCSNPHDCFSYQRAWCPLLVSQKLARFLVWRCWGENPRQEVLRRRSLPDPVPLSLAHKSAHSNGTDL